MPLKSIWVILSWTLLSVGSPVLAAELPFLLPRIFQGEASADLETFVNLEGTQTPAAVKSAGVRLLIAHGFAPGLLGVTAEPRELAVLKELCARKNVEAFRMAARLLEHELQYFEYGSLVAINGAIQALANYGVATRRYEEVAAGVRDLMIAATPYILPDVRDLGPLNGAIRTATGETVRVEDWLGPENRLAVGRHWLAFKDRWSHDEVAALIRADRARGLAVVREVLLSEPRRPQFEKAVLDALELATAALRTSDRIAYERTLLWWDELSASIRAPAARAQARSIVKEFEARDRLERLQLSSAIWCAGKVSR